MSRITLVIELQGGGHNLDSAEMSVDELVEQEHFDPNARGSTGPAPVPTVLALPAPVALGEVLHLEGTSKSAYRLLDGPVLTTSSNANPQRCMPV